MKDAVKTLERQGFKVQIDSTFVSYKNPLEVLFQEPEQGATVKIGRTIFLTINRKTPPSIKMPNLVNMSFRNGMLEMQSYRLVMGDTIYRPDVAAGSILEQWYKGKPIAAGTLGRPARLCGHRLHEDAGEARQSCSEVKPGRSGRGV